MVPHRLTRWFLVLAAVALAIPVQLLALEATPAPGATQLYIGHSARLTARIPAHWHLIPEYGFAYGDEDGVFSSTAIAQLTLQEACETSATEIAIDGAYEISETIFSDAPACEIDVPSSVYGLPLTVMVIENPNPFASQGVTVGYLAILATPQHFEDILSTVSFDVSTLTGPEIAHSILDIVEALSYYSDEVDWVTVRQKAEALSAPDEVNAFITDVLLPALYAAGDNHSFLMPPIPPGGGENRFPPPPAGEMRGNLGYIEIPSGALPNDWNEYVDAGLGTVAELEPQACGWIVDLRANVGGSVPPMVQSLLPFFPEGRLFGFVDKDGNESWVSRDGDRLVMERDGMTVPYGSGFDTPLPAISNPDAPIAVLIGPRTMSAGEYTLLGLLSRTATRTFGQPTGGYTTGNIGLEQLDGSILALASGAALDVDGNVYTGKIQPDEWNGSQSVAGNAQGMDGTIVAAEKWLLQQPSCQGSATPAASPAP